MIVMGVSILMLIAGAVCWYGYYSFELWLNGAFGVGVLRALWQEFLWIVPGGSRRRGEFIRHSIEAWQVPGRPFVNGHMCSVPWDYKQIVEGNHYEEVGRVMLPGLSHFVGTHIVLPLVPLLAWCAAVYFARQL